MRQPEGFVDAHNPTHVLSPPTQFAWVKQSARYWNEMLHLFLLSVGYVQVPSDGCLYRKASVSVIIAVYNFFEAKFTDGVLHRFGMESSKPEATPQEVNIDNRGDPHGDIKQAVSSVAFFFFFY